MILMSEVELGTIKSIAVEQYRRAANQWLARWQLRRMKDKRYKALHVDKNLVLAATTWPEHLPFAPQNILDIGAHQGEISRQLSVLYQPRFVGMVEPIPELASKLKHTTFAPSQCVFGCAVGRQQGIAELNVLEHMPSTSLLEVTAESEVLFEKPMAIARSIQVPVRTLDDIFADCDIDELDFLKIDVQGYELEVIAGGLQTLKKTKLVMTEVSFFSHYHRQPLFLDVYSALAQHGFHLRTMFGWSYDNNGLPLQCDALFISNHT
jgi:FkbM family methyltransferase